MDLGIIIQVLFLLLLLVPPLVSKRVEHNIEMFFLVVAVLAATVGGLWSPKLIEEAALHPVATYTPGVGYLPIGITQVVLAAGLAFYLFRKAVASRADLLAKPAVLSLLIFALGLGSSVISAIVAAAVLAELLAFAKMPHEYKTKAAVYGAFAIGLGAALLPIGEPLSTIAVAKLKQGFFYLVEVLIDAVVAAVAFFALYSYFSLKRLYKPGIEIEPYEPELKEILLRSAKIYIFIFALTILGEFFKPLANIVAELSNEVLYLFGLVSAIVDNATLVAALVAPGMAADALRAFLLSIVIAGGLTVPGNAPNIVLATVLKIGFREWIRLALLIGLAVYATVGVYVLFLVPHPPFYLNQ